MQFAHFSANLQQNYNGLWYLTLRMIKTRVKPGFFIGKPEKTRNPGFLTDRAKQQPYILLPSKRKKKPVIQVIYDLL